MQNLLAQAEQNNAFFVARTRMLHAQAIDQGFIVTIESQKEITQLKCNFLINSAGLHSEQVAKNIVDMPAGLIPKLHWCRGHYFSYAGKSPFNQLIYPIPETSGLGIHATLDLAGQLKFGPDTQYIDQLDYNFPGDLKAKFVQAIQKYFPDLNQDKLHPAYTGIRPKLQGVNDPFKDFVIQDESDHGINGLINLFGIESPGLTASLAIADQLVQQLSLNK